MAKPERLCGVLLNTLLASEVACQNKQIKVSRMQSVLAITIFDGRGFPRPYILMR